MTKRCAQVMAVAGGLLLASPSVAQQPVVTMPVLGTTSGGNASGSIAVTDTFQVVFPAAASQYGAAVRRGCTIENKGGNNMWVAEGVATASATEDASVQVAPGQVYYCAIEGLALYGVVSITGTAGDKFYAAQY